MTGIDSDIIEVLRVACKEYKMTYQEIADSVGVGKYVVYRWANGMSKITRKNYEKVAEVMNRLKGKNVRYPRQAISILRGEE